MELKLTVYDNQNRSLARRISLPCTIGRSRSVAFPVPDPLISRRHCEILIENNRVVLRDLSSLNGTFLGGRRITVPTPLRPGEFFAVGEYRFCLSNLTEQERQTLPLSIPQPSPAPTHVPSAPVNPVSQDPFGVTSPIPVAQNNVDPFGFNVPASGQADPFFGLTAEAQVPPESPDFLGTPSDDDVLEFVSDDE